MTRMGVYDQIKSAFQDIVAPEIHALRGEMRVTNESMTSLEARLTEKITALDQKIDGVDARLGQKIDGVDGRLGAKIDGVDGRLDARIDGLTGRFDALRAEMQSMRNELISEIRRVDTRIEGIDRDIHVFSDIRERLAALEARRTP